MISVVIDNPVLMTARNWCPRNGTLIFGHDEKTEAAEMSPTCLTSKIEQKYSLRVQSWRILKDECCWMDVRREDAR